MNAENLCCDCLSATARSATLLRVSLEALLPAVPIPRALPLLSPLALTSPSIGVAPIYLCISFMSLVGPVSRDVPVSTMAWQPLAQKATVPPTCTLWEGARDGEHWG